jgi:hypothetical protein
VADNSQTLDKLLVSEVETELARQRLQAFRERGNGDAWSEYTNVIVSVPQLARDSWPKRKVACATCRKRKIACRHKTMNIHIREMAEARRSRRGSK